MQFYLPSICNNLYKITLFLLIATACFTQELPLAKVYNDKVSVDGWLMSEKLDGIRAIWDTKELKSKNGNKIYAPEWFVKKLPPFALDGELYTKRRDFENIASIVLDSVPSDRWSTITYNIFETPLLNTTFENRIKHVQSWLDANHVSFIVVVPQIVCKNKAHLSEFLTNIERQGGEGVILRDPSSLYATGRSDTYLKVKSFLDAEAKVVGYKIGTGKYKGVVGSLELVNEAGVRFFVGSGLDDELRKNPPKIGSIVTYKYKEPTKSGKPRHPSFLRVRDDYAWKGSSGQ